MRHLNVREGKILYPTCYCVCVKRITLWNCLCSSSSPSSSCDFASVIRNIRKFGAKSTVTKNSAPFFVSSTFEVVTEIEDEVVSTRKFNLAAVINHSGNLNSGHYTCLVKDGETWWHCNDKAVVRVNLDDINKLLPYVLFYQAK